MLKKTITYENLFTKQSVTEEHYFHISKADLVEMEMEEHGSTYAKDGETLTGMQAKLQRIIDAQDGKAIMIEIKEMILRSYGRKDGDRFIKSKSIREDFASTEAFSQLLWELCTNPAVAGEFMNGIIPGNLEQIAEEVRAQVAETQIVEPGETQTAEPTDPLTETDSTGLVTTITPRVLTQAEVVEMDRDELKSGLATGRYKLS